MDISLIVRVPFGERERWRRLHDFLDAVLAQGHTVRQCFFQGEAVLGATELAAEPVWSAFAERSGAELLLCSQAVEIHQAEPRAPFTVAGLGALTEAAVNSDRVISFV